MTTNELIRIINVKITTIQKQVEAFDLEGRNVNSLLAKIEAYNDVLELLSINQ